MIFINTRPTHRAQPLTVAMQQKGMTVFDLPLLELVAIDVSEREKHYQQKFCQQSDHYQALVVVSPTAARMGLSACPKGFVPKCAVIAVGHATAEVLRAEGWPVQCPDEYSNEGMIKMPALNKLGAGNQVLVWRGRGGRRVLVNFLQDNGVRVDAIAWYQRRCPEQAHSQFIELRQQLTALAPDTRPIVLISSGEAFTNWRLLFAELESDSIATKAWAQLTDFDYLTFGKRLTETLRELSLNCRRIEHLDTEEVGLGIQLLSKSR